MSNKMQCRCGSHISEKALATHIKTQKHKFWIRQNGFGPDCAILYVKNTRAPTDPIIDDLTRIMTYEWRNHKGTGCLHRSPSELSFVENEMFLGMHTCSCGAKSSSVDYVLASSSNDRPQIFTNSLCIHYISRHRESLSTKELDIIRSLKRKDVNYDEYTPTKKELQ